MEQTLTTIRVLVRKRGAIGIFYPMYFEIRTPEKHETKFIVWQEQYSDEYEPYVEIK